MKRAVAALAVVLLFSAVTAGAAEEFLQWGESPESYFMTAEERTAWRAVTSEADAEAFVRAFREKRGGTAFTEEVAKRAEMADKYLTVGKVKGSTMLRGKVIVLFGPPAGMDVQDRAARGGYASPASSAAVTDLGVGASATGADGDSNSMATSRGGRAFRDYTFTFAGNAHEAFKGKDLVVKIEVDAGSGKDRFAKGVRQSDIEALFEAVAKASIRQ